MQKKKKEGEQMSGTVTPAHADAGLNLDDKG
jgi:hypothetical protein